MIVHEWNHFVPFRPSKIKVIGSANTIMHITRGHSTAVICSIALR